MTLPLTNEFFHSLVEEQEKKGVLLQRDLLHPVTDLSRFKALLLVHLRMLHKHMEIFSWRETILEHMGCVFGRKDNDAMMMRKTAAVGFPSESIATLKFVSYVEVSEENGVLTEVEFLREAGIRKIDVTFVFTETVQTSDCGGVVYRLVGVCYS